MAVLPAAQKEVQRCHPNMKQALSAVSFSHWRKENFTSQLKPVTTRGFCYEKGLGSLSLPCPAPCLTPCVDPAWPFHSCISVSASTFGLQFYRNCNPSHLHIGAHLPIDSYETLPHSGRSLSVGRSLHARTHARSGGQAAIISALADAYPTAL